MKIKFTLNQIYFKSGPGSMFWGKRKKEWTTKKRAEKRSQTIDLRKKRSMLKLKGKNTKESEDLIQCIICNKIIKDKPKFCNQYVTRTRLCNAGPFCSDSCWEKHLDNTTHY